MSVETDADEAAKSAIAQESPGNGMLAGCNILRGMESVAPVQDGTKRVAMVRDIGSCCSSAKVSRASTC